MGITRNGCFLLFIACFIWQVVGMFLMRGKVNIAVDTVTRMAAIRDSLINVTFELHAIDKIHKLCRIGYAINYLTLDNITKLQLNIRSSLCKVYCETVYNASQVLKMCNGMTRSRILITTKTYSSNCNVVKLKVPVNFHALFWILVYLRL